MIDLKWDTESENVIIWQIESGWTWDDFHHAIDDSWIMIRELAVLPASVSMILCMPNETRFPRGSYFASISRGMSNIEQTNGIVVVVIVNQFHSSIINVMRHAIPSVGTRLYAVKTLEAAHQKISEFRQQLID